MKNLVLLAAAIPYEQGERYARGEHIEVPILAAVLGMLGVGLMVWYIRRVQKEKRQRAKKGRK